METQQEDDILLQDTLVHKYNVQVPRYTSYPSLPHWHNMPKNEEYPAILNTAIHNSKEGISIYIHLPFCESLCTYCGCNTRITINHAVEEPYILALLEEWNHYLEVLDKKPVVKEIHLGGGTPTFFSPQNLQRLITGILSCVDVAKNPEFSIEAHPGVTTWKHLEVLSERGSRRVSFGVQDFNPQILKAINRKQTADQVAQITRDARALGFTSVNYDFVYGLPFQTKQDIIEDAIYLNLLRPDRIAFYSYAHVPWKKGGQRKFSENDLPGTVEKLALYETGKKLFMEMGYKAIGMDHFAFPEDDLYIALKDKTLSR
ncbi:MAG TPA: radical SAM protein, partial [Bacteroidia bacterium]|nr:radical SAM protein [Bacteroidia bacterium]